MLLMLCQSEMRLLSTVLQADLVFWQPMSWLNVLAPQDHWHRNYIGLWDCIGHEG